MCDARAASNHWQHLVSPWRLARRSSAQCYYGANRSACANDGPDFEDEGADPPLLGGRNRRACGLGRSHSAYSWALCSRSADGSLQLFILLLVRWQILVFRNRLRLRVCRLLRRTLLRRRIL